jgi:cbb3-type cytochrome oxidase maturation protein
MGVIYLLIGVSVVIAIVFLSFFLWASKTGQFDDDYTPSVRILFDDDQQNKKQLKDNLDGTGKI